MIITKEQQEAWLTNYAKDHNTDECYGFIDGMNKAIEVISKSLEQVPTEYGS